MHRRTLFAVALAAMLALAGCAGSTTPGAPTAGGNADGSGGGADATVSTGTVQFYVSDQPAAIEDFEHLNVTITRIGFERAGDSTDDGTETATPTPNATAAADNTTATATDTTATATPGNDTAATEENDEDAGGEEADDEERAGWETVEVDSRTVDLTRLRGDNATLVGTPEVQAGEYTTVFVHVDSINATLTTGESVNVKLPSEKLQLNRGFTLGPNETVQFVYDINVVKAGNSGKYILKPVISQSGPDQPIREVDGDDDGADDGAGPDGSAEGEGEGEESDADEDETESDETDGTETDDGDRGGPPDDRGNGN